MSAHPLNGAAFATSVRHGSRPKTYRELLAADAVVCAQRAQDATTEREADMMRASIIEHANQLIRMGRGLWVAP